MMTAPRRNATRRSKPPWARLLWRGVRKRCPECGGGGIYATWFRMKERCPTCGLRFEREPGFFVGAYLINLALAFTLLFLTSMVFVAWKAANPDAGVVAPIGAGIVIALVAPPLFYPYSRTLWSAIDIGMTPLEPAEREEAAASIGSGPGRGA